MSAYYIEVVSDGAQSLIDGFLSIVGSNFQLDDGATQLQGGGWVSGQIHKVGIAYDDTLMNINVDGAWVADTPYDGTMLQGLLDVFRTPSATGKYYNLRRYDSTDLAMGKEIIDSIMGEATTITVGNAVNAYGYSSAPAFGAVVSGGTFAGATITHLEAETLLDIVRVNFNNIQLGGIDEIVIKAGGTVTILAWSAIDSDYRNQDRFVAKYFADSNGQDIDITLHAEMPDLTALEINLLGN